MNRGGARHAIFPEGGDVSDEVVLRSNVPEIAEYFKTNGYASVSWDMPGRGV
jgi:hypothetical protein